MKLNNVNVLENPIEMNEKKCPHCGATHSKSLFQIEGIDIYECLSCEISFSDYDPSKSQDLYIEDYYSGENNGYGDYASEIKTHKATFSKRLETVEGLVPEKGILLDYGCAIGHLCMVAKDRGWTVFGSDFSNFGAEETKKNFDVETFVSDVTFPPVKHASVDVVCMYDLIEHIPSPSKAVKNVAPIIKPGGVLHLVTPDVGSISQKILGASWFHFKPREHLYYFNKKTMRSLLENNGYEVVSLKTSYSYMTLEDIVKRFEKYFGEFIIGMVSSFLSLIKLSKIVVPLAVGNLEAIARPVEQENIKSFSENESIQDTKLSNILKCGSCGGDKISEDYQCSSCGSYFALDNGIPNSKVEMKKAA